MPLRYINMPKLVAHYLREFSVRVDEQPSFIYKWIFCMCLPFVPSSTHRRARLIALALAECKNSRNQIFRLVSKITGATFEYDPLTQYSYVSYDGSDDDPLVGLSYNDESNTMGIIYQESPNAGTITITLGEARQSDVEAYLEILIPWYVEAIIIWQ